MALSIQSINADAAFLLTFTPSADTNPSSPSSFTVLIDPWLEGPTHVYHPKFSQTTRVGTSSVASLADLDHQPDVIACSQDKSDHCNKATLTRLAPDCKSRFVSTPAAVKKIRSWNHFDPEACKPLSTYSPTDPDTVFRHVVPAASDAGTPGMATISILAPAFDLTGLHNAIGITYRPPLDSTSSPNSSSGLSLLYAPHGIPNTVAKTWADTHLARESALPLTALLHNFNEIDNPWYLGGTIAHGVRQGYTIARSLLPRVWVGVHDEEKALSGVAIRLMKTRVVGVEEVKERLREDGFEVEGDEGIAGSVDALEQNGDTTSGAQQDGLGTANNHAGSEVADEAAKSNGSGNHRMKVVVLGVGEQLRVNA